MAAADGLEAVRAALRAAIAVGAPAYNAGDVRGCVRAYTDTAQRLLAAGDAPDAAAARLRAGLSDAGAAGSEADAAWALRRAFDAVLAGTPSAVLSFRDGVPAGASLEIVNDTVMGGASSATLRHSGAHGALLFAGTLVAANGGFASFRCAPRAWPTDALGVRVVAASEDGAAREYKVTARSDGAYDGVGYQAVVSIGPGAAPQTLHVPFSAFRASFRGRDVAGAKPLCAASLRTVGLMLSRFDAAAQPIAGFVAGPFALAVHELGTYAAGDTA